MFIQTLELWIKVLAKSKVGDLYLKRISSHWQSWRVRDRRRVTGTILIWFSRYFVWEASTFHFFLAFRINFKSIFSSSMLYFYVFGTLSTGSLWGFVWERAMETERVLHRSLYTDYDDGSLSHRKYSSDMTQIWFRSYTNTIIVNKYKYEDEATAIDLCTLIMTWCERKYFFNIWQIWKKV